MRPPAVATLAVVLLSGCGRAPGEDPQPQARVEVSACVACHGADGISRGPTYPNLAGQKYAYLLVQMRAYRSGRRQHQVMTSVLAGRSDADLAGLARYYADLDPCAP